MNNCRYRSLLFIIVSIFFQIGSAPFSLNFAQNVRTSNQYICGIVNPVTGLITISLSPGRLGIDGQLTYNEHSYFTCRLGAFVYSNNDQGIKPDGATFDWQLTDGKTLKNADTIVTTWTRHSVDIIQEIFPAVVGKSGQIILRWKFLNHTGAPINTQSQMLLDIMLSDPTDPIKNDPNDGPIIFHPISYSDKWQQYSTAKGNIPWTYAACMRDMPNNNPGKSLQGYLDYASLGTIKPSRFTIGNWREMSLTVVGIPTVQPWPIGRPLFSDNAVLIEFPAVTATQNVMVTGGCTAIGTGNLELCTGTFMGVIFDPPSFLWDSKNNSYLKNPVTLDLYLYRPDNIPKMDTGKLQFILDGDLLLVGPSPKYDVIGISGSEPYSIPAPGAASHHSFNIRSIAGNPCPNAIVSTITFSGQSNDGTLLFNGGSCEYVIPALCDTNKRDPPYALFDSSELHFGTIKSGQESTKIVSASAFPFGSSGVLADSILILGVSANRFTIISQPDFPIKIDGGQSQDISISYRPIGVEYDSALLALRYLTDGISQTTPAIALRGQGEFSIGVHKQNSNLLEIDISPNPFDRQCSISSRKKETQLSISLTDILGNTRSFNAMDRFIIDADDLNLGSGAYVLSITDGVETIRRLIIKR